MQLVTKIFAAAFYLIHLYSKHSLIKYYILLKIHSLCNLFESDKILFEQTYCMQV